MKTCFFTSTGDDLFLVDFIKDKYPHYDMVCNYYGSNNKLFSYLKNICICAENNYLTKFPSIKKMYSKLSLYDYVIVFDDDAKIVSGSIDSIIELMHRYNVAIASPSHDPKGKITYQNHFPQKGDHLFRYVNFVEMNFPIFSNNALYQYMAVYDGFLVGWGNDLFYSSVLRCDKVYNAAIIDSVVVHNPKNSNRINKFMKEKDRENQWLKFQKEKNLPLSEPKPQTLKYIYA
jgi:hypothetical protein